MDIVRRDNAVTTYVLKDLKPGTIFELAYYGFSDDGKDHRWIKGDSEDFNMFGEKVYTCIRIRDGYTQRLVDTTLVKLPEEEKKKHKFFAQLNYGDCFTIVGKTQNDVYMKVSSKCGAVNLSDGRVIPDYILEKDPKVIPKFVQAYVLDAAEEGKTNGD